jgi:hypothetical protein
MIDGFETIILGQEMTEWIPIGESRGVEHADFTR